MLMIRVDRLTCWVWVDVLRYRRVRRSDKVMACLLASSIFDGVSVNMAGSNSALRPVTKPPSLSHFD
jgi:hypothetical protein